MNLCFTLFTGPVDRLLVRIWDSQILVPLLETRHAMSIEETLIRISPEEQCLVNRLDLLNANSGSHSPSVATVQQAIPELNVNIDACFLSNPLATDLFWSYLRRDAPQNSQLFKRMIEAYPSQNRIIAEKLSSTVGVEPGCIFVSNGATEAIQAVIQNFSSHIHVNVPTFSPYYEFAGPEHRVTRFQLDPAENFAVDPQRYVESVLKSGADTAILISPNNPDGYLIPDYELNWILSKLSNLSTVIVDESFIHFASRDMTGSNYKSVNDGLPTLVGITEQFENVTVVKSMSKDFGIAGIRAGYAIMNPSRVDRLLDHGYLWNISGIAEYFFSLFNRLIFLDEYREMLNTYLKYIERFTSMTSGINFLQAYPTDANFQLIQIPSGVSSDLFANLMLIRHGIYVRSCGDKIGLDGEFLRVAIRTESENAAIIGALSNVLGTIDHT